VEAVADGRAQKLEKVERERVQQKAQLAELKTIASEVELERESEKRDLATQWSVEAAQQQNERRKLVKNNQELQRQVEAAAKQRAEIADEFEYLRSEVDEHRAALDERESKMLKQQTEADDLKEEIKNLSDRIEKHERRKQDCPQR
jgi:chromosome segregation ATPase